MKMYIPVNIVLQYWHSAESFNN